MEDGLRLSKGMIRLALFLALSAGVMLFGRSIKVQAAAICKYGDVNEDGKVDVTDLLQVMRHISVATGETPYEEHPDWLFDEWKYRIADVNQDGSVNDEDSELIQYHIATVKNPTIGKLIITVTLADSDSGEIYDCFPVIYDVKNASGCRYPELKNISVDGYTFNGWYTSVTGGTQINSNSQVTDKNDHTLYARWTVNKYQLFYNANGGDCSASGIEIPYQSGYGTLPLPVRNGYRLVGWYTAPEGGAEVTENTKMEAAPVTIYAHWEANTYRVIFDSNGGNRVEDKTVTFDSKYGNLPVPKRQKYVFLGWYTMKSGGSQVISTDKVTAVKDHTLYAHWKSETEISLNKTNIVVYTGKKYQLRAIVTGKSGRKTWSSSNSKIASVNADGKVTAKKAGVAKITVTVNGFKKVCKVTVKKISLKVNKTSLTMGINQTKLLSASVVGPSQKIAWSTSNKNIVKITSDGKITALKRGKATIRAKANGLTANVKVTVNYFDIKDFLTKGAGGKETVTEMKKLAKAVGKMKAGNKKKYPDAYYAGNHMVIGVNNHPAYKTDYDEYVRIENNGNKQALFYGVKIGNTKSQLEKKFKNYNIVSYDGGKSYSNANGWAVFTVFKNKKLVKYVFLSKPTSGENSDEDLTEIVSYKSLSEKGFVYKNDKFMYGIAFGSTGKAYIGIWDSSGTFSSYEDFLFEVKEGTYDYSLKGGRSSYIYDIHLVPHKESVEVRISCRDVSYGYFNVDQKFQYERDALFVDLAR